MIGPASNQEFIKKLLSPLPPQELDQLLQKLKTIFLNFQNWPYQNGVLLSHPSRSSSFAVRPLTQDEDPEETKAIAQSILPIDPLNIEGINSLAHHCLYSGRFQEAKRLSEYVAKYVPRDARLYATRAYLAYHERKLEEAQVLLKKALECDPPDSLALITYTFMRSDESLNFEYFKELAARVNNLLEMAAKDVDVQNLHARLCLFEGNNSLASHLAQRILESDPENQIALATFQRALPITGMKEYGRDIHVAREWMIRSEMAKASQTLKQLPQEFPEVKTLLARQALLDEDIETTRHLLNALRHEIEDPFNMGTKAFLCFLEGNDESAKSLATNALKKSNLDYFSLFVYYFAIIRENLYTQQIFDLSEKIDKAISDNPHIGNIYARMSLIIENNIEAQKQANIFLKEYPQDVFAQRTLAKATQRLSANQYRGRKRALYF